MHPNSVRLIRHTVLSAVFVLALLIPTTAISAQELPERYEPFKLASGVAGTPGTVAWSPDGKHIAYITNKIEIFHTSTGKKSSVKLEEPYFLNWTGEQRLMVLHRDGKLVLVDANTLDKVNIKIPPNAVAVYPAWGEQLLVFTSWSKALSFGVEVGYGIHVMELSNNSLTKAFSNSSILPLRYSGTEFLKGWMSAGPSSISGEAMLLRFIVPPNAPPYIKVLLLDAFTGTQREVIARYRGDWLRSWGSWSPTGNSAALTDENGRLRVLPLTGKALSVDDSVAGLYPAWDPRGGRIFFGGYLIDEDGGNRMPIVPGEIESAAFFSPDGGRMAIASDSDLWLLNGIEPSPNATKVSTSLLRERVALLKELFVEGFITEKEYFERLSKIINQDGSMQ
jgi:hypothetical protein